MRAALLVVLALCGTARAQTGSRPRWTETQANEWAAKQPWLVGSNYIPATAINELEMFQVETFNPGLIDKELGLGESIGMNTMRVFLQDQLWQQDAQGFTKRLDTFLGIAAKHHIRPLLVLFDSCFPKKLRRPLTYVGRLPSMACCFPNGPPQARC